MENNVGKERGSSLQENRLNPKMRRSPKEIIAEGLKLSTKITDEKVVNALVDKVMKSESYGRSSSHDDFLFGIAESLESIRCETTSKNEYFSWIDGAQRIISHMTDGCITMEDLKEKHHFLDISWQREAEILTCLSLYERSDNPLAKERKEELLIKLRRLRQLRSAIITNTKDKLDDEPLTQEEKEQRRRVILTLEEMKEADENADYQNAILRRHLELLRLSHEEDIEFYENYSFYTRMLEDQRNADLQRQEDRQKELNYAARLERLRHRTETPEDIRDRINRLTGRSSESQVSKYAKNYTLRGFDARTYQRLSEIRKYQMQEE